MPVPDWCQILEIEWFNTEITCGIGLTITQITVALNLNMYRFLWYLFLLKTITMIRSIFLLVFSLILYSCSAPKEFTFENRSVTEKSFERKMKRYTKRFVREMPDEMKRILLNLDVVYDTIYQR